METDEERFWYPNLDRNLFIDCHLCKKVYPILENPLKEEFTFLAYTCKIDQMKYMKMTRQVVFFVTI